MIVKLQVPIASTLPPAEHLALLYDQSRHFELLTPITDEIKEQMKGRPKAFFEIDLKHAGDRPFRFVREVPGW